MKKHIMDDDVTEKLKPQFVAILRRYTKSTRVEEMASDLIECVKRDAPKIQVKIPVEPCNHIMRVEKLPDGVKRLTCKHCGVAQPLTFKERED